MYVLRYRPQAQRDLKSIKRYISKESGSARIALNFTDKLRAHCLKLSQYPAKMGRPRPELDLNIRSSVFGKYSILFEYNDSYFDVVTIIEGHQDIEMMFENNDGEKH